MPVIFMLIFPSAPAARSADVVTLPLYPAQAVYIAKARAWEGTARPVH